MKTSLALTTLLLFSLAATGCHHLLHGPDDIAPSPPGGLRTATGDNFIELFWSDNREPDLAGYRVYVSASYDGRYEYIGSSDIAYYCDDGARNGNVYYYAVSAYDFDGNESDLSRDVSYDIPRPEGYNVLLSNALTSPGLSSYDFSRYAVVSVDDQYADMTYVSSSGTPMMQVDTDTDIQDMGTTGSILDIGQAPASGWSATHDVPLRVGHTYVVWTWDDHYAKFRVTTVSSGRVVFDWAYQLVPANRLLKRNPGKERK